MKGTGRGGRGSKDQPSSSSSSSSSNQAWSSPGKSGPPPTLSLGKRGMKSVTPTQEIVETILCAERMDNYPLITQLIIETLSNGQNSQGSNESYFFTTIAMLWKIRPNLFDNEPIVYALSQLLSNQQRSSLAPLPPVAPSDSTRKIFPLLAASILHSIYRPKPLWPLTFFQTYVEDAFEERNWVEHLQLRDFVRGILTACPYPSKTFFSRSSDDTSMLDDVADRFSREQQTLAQDFLARYIEANRSLQSKNFIKGLSSTINFPYVRKFSAELIDGWMISSKEHIKNPARELFQKICVECCTQSEEDQECCSLLIHKMAKIMNFLDVSASYIQLLTNNPHFTTDALTNLLSAYDVKNHQPISKVYCLIVSITQDFEKDLLFAARKISEKSDPGYLRLIFRKLVRPNRDEKNLLDIQKFAMYVFRDPVLSKNHLFAIELITTCFLTFWSPSSEDPSYLRKVSDVQMDILNWIREIGAEIPQKDVFFLFNKLFFRIPIQEYFPGSTLDHEKNSFQSLSQEVPLQETTILRIIVVFISDPNLDAEEGLRLLLSLTERAAVLHYKTQALGKGTSDMLEMRNNLSMIVNALLRLTAYRHPVASEKSEQFGALMIADRFWIACLILMIIGSVNPETMGQEVWRSLGSVRLMMEMCLKQNFDVLFFSPFFPNEIDISRNEDDIAAALNDELRSMGLTSAVLGDKTSGKLMSFAHMGTTRKVPQKIVEQLQQLDQRIPFELFLASYRPSIDDSVPDNPKLDFLEALINENIEQSPYAKWLFDIVHKNQSLIGHFPLTCLNNFILCCASRFPSSSPLPLAPPLQSSSSSSPSSSPRNSISLSVSLSSSTDERSLSQLPIEETLSLLQFLRKDPSLIDKAGVFFMQLVHSQSQQQRDDAFRALNILSLAADTEKTIDYKGLSQCLEEKTTNVLSIFIRKSEDHCQLLLSSLLRLICVETQPERLSEVLAFLISVVRSEGNPEALNRLNFSNLDSFAMALCLQITLSISQKRFLFNRLITGDVSLHKDFLFALVSGWKHFLSKGLRSCEEINLFVLQRFSIEGLIPKDLVWLVDAEGKTLGLLPSVLIDSVAFMVSASTEDLGDEGKTLLDELQKRFLGIDRPSLDLSLYNRIALFESPSQQPLISLQNAQQMITHRSTLICYAGIAHLPIQQLLQMIFGFGMEVKTANAIIEKIACTPLQVTLPVIQDFARTKSPSKMITHLRLLESLGVQNTAFLKEKINADPVPDRKAKPSAMIDDSSSKSSGPVLNLLDRCYVAPVEKIQKMMESERSVSASQTKVEEKKSTKMEDETKTSSRRDQENAMMKKSGPVDEQFVENAILSGHPDLQSILHRYICRKARTEKDSNTSITQKLIEWLRLVQSSSAPSSSSISSGLLCDWIIKLGDYSHPLKEESHLNAISELCFKDRAFVSTMLMVDLLHHSSFQVQRKLLDYILSPPGKSSRLHPTTCLNFVSSFVHHPRSWNVFTASNSRSTQTGPSQKPLLDLTDETTATSLLRMIIREQSLQLVQDAKASGLGLLHKRMRLFVLSLSEEPSVFQKMIARVNSNFCFEDFVENRADLLVEFERKQRIQRRIQLVLYYHFPRVMQTAFPSIDFESMVDLITKEVCLTQQQSQIETVLNQMLRMLMDPNSNVVAFPICCRLAINFPSMVIRYLPTVCSLLRGRSHLSAKKFVSRQYDRLYHNVISLLHLLQPTVFESPSFNELLGCIFEMFTAPTLTKDFGSQFTVMMTHFANLLHYYGASNMSKLIPYKNVLEQLQKQYPQVVNLSVMVNLLHQQFQAPSSSQTMVNAQGPRGGPSDHFLAMTAEIGAFSEAHQRTRLFGGREIEVQAQTTQRIEQQLRFLHQQILQKPQTVSLFDLSFISRLLSLSSHPSAPIRFFSIRISLFFLNSCHRVLQRDVDLSGYLECFRSADPDIVQEAISLALEFYQAVEHSRSEILTNLISCGKQSIPALNDLLASHNAQQL